MDELYVIDYIRFMLYAAIVIGGWEFCWFAGRSLRKGLEKIFKKDVVEES